MLGDRSPTILIMHIFILYTILIISSSFTFSSPPGLLVLPLDGECFELGRCVGSVAQGGHHRPVPVQHKVQLRLGLGQEKFNI